MEYFKDFLAALGVLLNGLPQGLLALTFGFASVPTALAFFVGAIGNTAVGSISVISYQAETITVAGTMGKTMKERLSMIFFGAAIMLIIGLFGFLEKIVEFIGPIITNGMMAGVGIMLAKVSIDMTKTDRLVGASSLVSAVLIYFLTKDLVYTILGSVVLSSIVGRIAGTIAPIPPLDNEKLQLQKLTVNQTVIRGALAMVALNIGANIAFGKINGEIGNQEVNVDHLTVISSIADMVSALFGGAPVEVVISATSTAPHAVFAGVLMMVMMGVILLAGLLPKIGRFIPSTSIAGFLFVLGLLVTLPTNATAALAGGEDSVVGGVTMAVTALTDPFLGMLAGIITQVLLSLFE
ncbi:NCS2 family permease [Savagea sp. SN6]|uniref:NCS2 family permease n=1 Tax=Savagea serpentis TaxID=2785297 RepID=A0A8J7KCK7_9BACL|nr:NCS2 family permease [Savagea serpentis]MBF4501607.1 NCS2 family permease [Savagea serpentis]